MRLEDYYSKPAKVKLPWWSKFTDKFIKNWTRTEIASKLGFKGENCLDIACGDGELINKFLSVRYKRLVGVDISSDQINKARKMASSNTKFIVSNIETYLDILIKRKIIFDDVYMLAILEHVFWPSDLVSKVSKIVKKKGKIVVEVPNVVWLPYRIDLLKGKFPLTAPAEGAIPGVHDEHIRFFTLNTLDEIFNNYGFKRIKLCCSGRLVNIKNIFPQVLYSDLIAVYQKITNG